MTKRNGYEINRQAIKNYISRYYKNQAHFAEALGIARGQLANILNSEYQSNGGSLFLLTLIENVREYGEIRKIKLEDFIKITIQKPRLKEENKRKILI